MPYKYLSFYLDDWLSLLLYLCTPKDIKEIIERKATCVIVGIEFIVGTQGSSLTSLPITCFKPLH